MAQMSHPGVRVLIANRAQRQVGLGSRDDPLGRLQRYIEFCWTHDNYQQAVEMAKKQSTCMLACGGLLRVCGYHCVELDEPYAKRNGMIGPIMVGIGHREKAWTDFTVASSRNQYLSEVNAGGFNLADMVWMGLEDGKGVPVPGFGGLSHMFTLTDQRQVDIYDESGEKFIKTVDMSVSADGGQLDPKGGWCISNRYRYLEQVGDQYWFRTLDFCRDEKGQIVDDSLFYERDRGRRVWGVLDPTCIAQVVAWALSQDDFDDEVDP